MSDIVDGRSMANPEGGWIRTLSGGRFYPLAPRVRDVDLAAVAHALAVKCRYGGHCTGFYSVAQHSVHVSHHCGPDPRIKLKGLLHDSDEAYSPFGDIPRPVKVQMEKEYPLLGEIVRKIGDDIRNTVYIAFGLSPHEPPEVKAADNAILWDERRAFMTGSLTHMPEDAKGLGIEIVQWPWELAEAMFIDRFFQLRQEIASL